MGETIKALKKEKFLICSVSLDIDKEAWLKASDRDTAAPRQTAPAVSGSPVAKAAASTSAPEGKTDAQLAKEASQRLYLLLPSRAHMDTVKRLCAAYPGDVPVYVKLQDEGIALLLSRESWCSLQGDMLTACKELYGEGGVVVR
mgnify:CR=1 FL=1